MNKIFIGIFITVILLGVALIMLSERLERKPGPPPVGLSMSADSSPAVTVPEPPAVLIPEAFLPPLPVNDEPAMPSIVQQEAILPANGNQPLPAPAIPEEIPAKQSTVPPAIQNQETVQPHIVEQAIPPRPEKTGKVEQQPTAKQAESKKNLPDKSKTESSKATTPASRAILDRFVVFARDGGATVRMTGNGPISYNYMNLDNPPRLVIDLNGDWKMTPPGVPANALVSKVRVGKTQGKSRVVIDLKEKPRRLRMVHSDDRKNLDVRLDQ
ncbi:MAG: AMIN domain-containing protein [Desulfovibrio sp.]|nr:AMIN domain-containing protein [Desulfovibrio sp.]